MVDTLRPIYPGKPSLTGLTAVFDSTRPIVRLMWNRVNLPSLRDYVVYRDGDTVGVTSDTSFSDTLSGGYLDTTARVTLVYRVAPRDTSFSETSAFGDSVVVVTHPNPTKVFSIVYPDSAFIGDSIPLGIYPYSGTGLWNFSWKFLGTPDDYFYPATGATTWLSTHDTLASEIAYVLKATSADSTTTFYDTASIVMKVGWEKVDGNHYPALGLYPMNAIVKDSTIRTVMASAMDTVVWISAYSPSAGSGLYPLPFTPTSGIALSRSALFLVGQGNILWHSSDGVNWFPDASHPIGSPGVAFDSSPVSLLGTPVQLVAIQYQYDTLPLGRVAVSRDGVTWTAGTTPFPNQDSLECSFVPRDTAGGVFVRLSDQQTALTYDFVNYTYRPAVNFPPDTLYSIRSVNILGSQLVAVSSLKSRDALLWFTTDNQGRGPWASCPGVLLDLQPASFWLIRTAFDYVVLNNQLYLITDNGIFRARR